MADGGIAHLTEDEAPLVTVAPELLERYPLPETVARDLVLSKTELAQAFDVSTNTITDWMADRNFPIISGGTHGKAYQFRLSEVYAWHCAKLARERAEAQQRAAEVAQLSFDITGRDPEPEAASASLGDRRNAVLWEKDYLVVGRMRRENIPTETAVGALEALAMVARDQWVNAPDRIARQLGLDGRQTELLFDFCDGQIDGLRETMREASEKMVD